MGKDMLSEDLMLILRMIRDKGGTDCSGTCHHRKPGEFHCHTMSQELKISSSGVKERILSLVRMGLLNRRRIERQGTYPLTKFTVSDEGRRILDSCGTRSEISGACR
jgi:DNA-binding MarR family transcriptional regulator